MAKTVAVIGALDTKGKENAFLVDCLKKHGLNVITVNVGIMEKTWYEPEYSNDVVAREGGSDIAALREKHDRALALEVMGKGALKIIQRLIDEGKLDGAVGVGGSGGTYMTASVFKYLPVGFPRVLASTIAFSGLGDEAFNNLTDTYVTNSIVDIESLNIRLRETLTKAAAVLNALVNVPPMEKSDAKGTIAITMWGITTPCGDRVARIMEENGYEVMVFHATGDGGKAMEDLIEQGKVDLVVDLTLAEVSHEVLGNEMGWVNHTRLTVAGRLGIPQVVIPGGLDAINLANADVIPERWANKGRKFHYHNPTLRAMRTTKEDLIQIGEVIGDRLLGATGDVEVFLPLKGLSLNDVEGGDFYEPEADAALFEVLHGKLDGKVSVKDMDVALNDPEFADALAEAALRLLNK